MNRGVIIKGISGFYYVDNGDNVVECKARGLFRLTNQTPMVGDSCTFEGTQIVSIEPRKCEFVRPPVANITQMVVVVTASIPAPDFYTIDKMLAMNQKKSIKSVLCLNKVDEADMVIERKLITTYESILPVVRCSTVIGRGNEELCELLREEITCFAGNSGVGKSSIINMIGSLDLKVGEISTSLNRGRHTTRHVELLPLSLGGYVVDTPGFGSFEFNMSDSHELQSLFVEFERSEPCKFDDCQHINEPKCGVKKALEEGVLSESRYRSYVQIYKELKMMEENKWK